MRIASQGELERIEAELELLPKSNAKQLDERWREIVRNSASSAALRPASDQRSGIPAAGENFWRYQVGNTSSTMTGGRSSSRAAIPGPVTKPRLKAGAVLLRKRHGTADRVTVLESGYEHNGQRFKSLSEIARRITGTRWSGPLFFGLRNRAQADANP